MLSLIVPTKGRPDGVSRLLKSIDIPLAVMICATKESDLPSNLEVINELLSINVMIENCSIVTALNKAAKLATNNIIVACDDMEFIPGSLCRVLVDAKPDVVTGFRTGNMPDSVPIPVIGIDYFKSMDNLARPEYMHFFWDQETIEVAQERWKYKAVTEYPLLNHYHPSVTKKIDNTHLEGRSEKWINDEAVYRSRLLHR